MTKKRLSVVAMVAVLLCTAIFSINDNIKKTYAYDFDIPLFAQKNDAVFMETIPLNGDRPWALLDWASSFYYTANIQINGFVDVVPSRNQDVDTNENFLLIYYKDGSTQSVKGFFNSSRTQYRFSTVTQLDKQLDFIYLINYCEIDTYNSLQEKHSAIVFSISFLNRDIIYDYNQGYTEGYANGTAVSAQDAYNRGYSAGLSSGGENITTGWFANFMMGFASLFSIQIFPNITLGLLVGIPLLLGIILLIFKMKGGG